MTVENTETPADQPIPEQTKVTPAADQSEETLLSGAGLEESTDAAKAGDATAPMKEEPKPETPEEKTARETIEAENKKLLETDDKELDDAQKAKKAELVKVQEAKAKGEFVPEGDYEIKIEGMDLNIDLLKNITPVLKEMKATQAQVQKLAEAYAPVIKAQVDTQQKAVLDNWKKEIEGWRTETLDHLGTNSKVELAYAARAISNLSDSPEEAKALRELLKSSGLGNHILLNKVFIKAGKSISQDVFPDGNPITKTGGNADLYDHADSKATLK